MTTVHGGSVLLAKGVNSVKTFFGNLTADYADDADFSSGRRVAARSCHGNGRSTLAGAGEPNEAGPVEAAVRAATRRTSQAARLSLQFDFAGDPPSPGFGVASTPATTDLRAASAGGVAGKALCGRLATHRNAMSLLPKLEVKCCAFGAEQVCRKLSRDNRSAMSLLFNCAEDSAHYSSCLALSGASQGNHR